MEFNLLKVKSVLKYCFKNPRLAYREFKKRFIYRNIWKFKKSSIFPLQKVYLMFTAECNLQCKMCIAPHRNEELKRNYVSKWVKEQLTLNELKKLIDDLSFWRPEIVLTGGEPLLRKEWYDFARYVKSKKLKINLQTNGTLLLENIEKICETIDTMIISLHGPALIHDEVTGCKGSFEKAVNGLKTLDNFKNINSLKKPQITIGFTICDINYRFLEEIISLLKDTKVNIDMLAFLHLLFINEECFNKYKEEVNLQERDLNVWKSVIHSPGDFDADYLIDEIEKIKQDKNKKFLVYFVPDLKLDEIKTWYGSSSAILPRFKHHKCFSPWIEIDIGQNGDVVSCIDCVLGNVREESILKIWANSRASKLRETVREKSPFSVCKGCCNLYR